MTPTAALTRIPLAGAHGASWTLIAGSPDTPVGDRSVPAQVPGEVHVDLLRAGLIPDPFDAANEQLLAWIGRTDWTYRGTFTWTAEQQQGHERHDLVADGLDTVAMVRLNDAEVARTANQHRGYRFEIGELLAVGQNELEISFSAPVTEAETRSAELGERPYTNSHPFNAIRKMASSYGWDWGADLAGAGIWKDLRIESWSGVRISSVRPLAGLDGTDGVLDVRVGLEWSSAAGPDAVRVGVDLADGDDELAGAEQVEPGISEVRLELRVPQVAPWWPLGHGRQPLYPVRVHLTTGAAGAAQTGSASDSAAGPMEERGALDEWQGRVGFRDVALSTAPDQWGSQFVISVNGRPIYVKGANWIPDDPFLTRLDAGRYRAGITDAAEAGINLLRVWGGGIVESDDFYDACDEAGVLVWQDFLLACAAYSEDEPLYSEFEAEAREAVTRLAKHPSLALWNGGNENIWGYVEWGWRTRLDGRSWGDGYYRELFSAIVAELDPRTPYSPGSPYSFADYHHPNDPRHGCTHLWEVWNALDYSHYRDSVPRFVSEFGFQGPPAWSTLTSVVHDQPLDPFGPQMLVHQKAADGNQKLERGLGEHLPHWGTDAAGRVAIDDWHWLTQLNQARAVRFGIGHFRSYAPLNQGTVVWQLNDQWPVISWAAVDSAGIRKPLWFALREVYRDRFVTVQPRTEPSGIGFGRSVLGTDRTLADQEPQTLAVVLHNDSDDTWSEEILVSRQPVGGGPALASSAHPVSIAPRSSQTVPLEPNLVQPAEPGAEFVLVETAAGGPAFWYFVEDPQLRLAAPATALTADAERVDGGYRVQVEAHALVKDLCLFPDRLDATARVDSGLVTLAAGQRHTFTVSTVADLDPAALTSAPVLRCVNDVLAQAGQR